MFRGNVNWEQATGIIPSLDIIATAIKDNDGGALVVGLFSLFASGDNFQMPMNPLGTGSLTTDTFSGSNPYKYPE